MIRLTKEMRIFLVIVAVADIMVFSRMTILPLVAIAFGGLMIALGIIYSYRPPCLIGLTVVSVAGAASTEIPSLYELDMLLTAIISLLVPVLVLIWLALSGEEDVELRISIMRRPALVAIGYGLICIWSAPLVALIVSLFAPTISMRSSITTEVAIVLLTTIAVGLVLTRGIGAGQKPGSLRRAPRSKL